MENKGLNIINSAYVLADKDTATDTAYRNIGAVKATFCDMGSLRMRIWPAPNLISEATGWPSNGGRIAAASSVRRQRMS